MSGRGPTARGGAIRISGSTVLVGGVLLLVVTLLAGLGRPGWIVGAVLLPVAGVLLASAAWSASEARGDGNAVLLARSGAPLLVTIAACVVLLALPGWLLDRANDELIAWSASDVVLVDRDLALTVEPADDAEPRCTAEARDLRTGRIRWSAPVQNGIELRDADTARVVGRLRIDGPVWARSEGDRIVVHRDDPDGGEDLVLVRRP